MSEPTDFAADLIVASPPTKLQQLTTSRRFGASVAGVVAAVGCYYFGMIDADKAAAWIERALEIYAALIGGEHVVTAWRQNGASLIEKLPRAESENHSP